MINLLPKEEKEVLAKDYLFRKIVVAEFVVIILLLVSLVILVASYYSTLAEGKSNKNLFEEAKKDSEGELLGQLQATGQDIKLKLGFFSRYNPPEKLLAETLEDIVSMRSLGISISNFSFLREEKGNKVTVKGEAKTRNSLLGFIERVKGLRFVSSVNSPVSNLIKENDIAFTLEINLIDNLNE